MDELEKDFQIWNMRPPEPERPVRYVASFAVAGGTRCSVLFFPGGEISPDHGASKNIADVTVS